MKDDLIEADAYALDSRDTRFVAIWAVLVLLLYVVGAFAGIRILDRYKSETVQLRQSWIASPTGERNASTPGRDVPTADQAMDVTVGVAVRRIGPFALRESSWASDFNIWFRWSGDTLTPSPGESFRIVNGQIEQREKIASMETSGQHYEEYHVVGRTLLSFDAARFPLGDEALLIQVEDLARPLQTLRYVADRENSYIAPGAMPLAVKLIKSITTVKMRSHQAAGNSVVHSRFVFAMLVAPNSASIYLKLFQALFASVAVALVALYIDPTQIDARFGLPVGGFFASVGNNLAISGLLPFANRLTLSDMVNLVGLVTIFLIVVQSAISLYLFDTMGRKRLARLFDHVSFAVLFFGYVAVNLALPLAAKST
ncbi:MAG TPA: hypothetical protein VHK70_06755 [Burkholderiaceae bacterium]|jgi:hypothetical protein|nr:hypothetical protein [Burkholderiaceae bacterium]